MLYFLRSVVLKKTPILLLFFYAHLTASNIHDQKVLICGICKNTARYFLQTKYSMETVGKQFLDYRIIIYENNSVDGTKTFLKEWQRNNPRMILLSETLSKKEIKKINEGMFFSRMHHISRARNKLLDYVMQEEFDDFDIVIIADMDFAHAWPFEVIYTIVEDTREWDAILANGLSAFGEVYDTYAYIDDGNVFTSALLGQWILDNLWDINASKTGDLRRVYSAFGGLGIYKRDAIKGCHYSPVVTANLEFLMEQWIENAKKRDNPFYHIYLSELSKLDDIKTVKEWEKIPQNQYPKKRGIKLNPNGIVWISHCFSKHPNQTLCEHIPFHADMIKNGHDKIFVHPRLIMHYSRFN